MKLLLWINLLVTISVIITELYLNAVKPYEYRPVFDLGFKLSLSTTSLWCIYECVALLRSLVI